MGETFKMRYYKMVRAAVDWPPGWRFRRWCAGGKLAVRRLSHCGNVGGLFWVPGPSGSLSVA